MKIYVDELPKNCAECKFCGRLKPPAERPEIECMHCNMAKTFNSISPFCPLQFLAGHDKKVRAEVVAEIRDIAGDYWVECEDYDSITKESKNILIMNNEDLEEILDRVLGGEE